MYSYWCYYSFEGQFRLKGKSVKKLLIDNLVSNRKPILVIGIIQLIKYSVCHNIGEILLKVALNTIKPQT